MISQLNESGVAERLWDMFKTMNERETIPQPAFTVFKLLGLNISVSKQEGLIRLLGQAASLSTCPTDFEKVLITGIFPTGVELSKEQKDLLEEVCKGQGFLANAEPISHLKLSFWARG
jgi:hypothetical protein